MYYLTNVYFVATICKMLYANKAIEIEYKLAIDT